MSDGDSQHNTKNTCMHAYRFIFFVVTIFYFRTPALHQKFFQPAQSEPSYLTLFSPALSFQILLKY